MALPASVVTALGLDSIHSDDSLGPVAPSETQGVVVRKNWYSSKLAFFDVRVGHGDTSVGQDDGKIKQLEEGLAAEEASSDERRGVIAFRFSLGKEHKDGSGEGGRLKKVDIVNLSSSFDVGDTVLVECQPHRLKVLEGERTFDAFNVIVLEKNNSKSESNPSSVPPPPILDKSIITATKAARAPRGVICKFWVNTRSCPVPNCALKHVSDEERKEARAGWMAERSIRKAATSSANMQEIGDVSDVHSKRLKKDRARIFVDWLVASIGKERLCAGSGVLDVAGGKGLISQALLQRGIPSKVIDPRDCTDKGKKKDAQRNEQIIAAFDQALWEDTDHADLLRDCSAVVAMHPDQATEPAMDFALAHKKLFAVVPCCVFGRQNNNRLTSGEEDADLVVTYEQYLAYLSSKHAMIQKSFLGFRGRDAVLHIFDYKLA